MIAVIAAALHVPSLGVSIIFFGVLALAFIGGLLPVITGERSFSCPHCRKMVKLGATTCHHCGQSVARPKKTKAVPLSTPSLKPGESLTPGGFLRRADGKVVVPDTTKKLIDAWSAAGSIKGLTMAEIVTRVGFNADAVPAKQYTNGYTHTWSLPGYTVSVLFGNDNRAIGIEDKSERLG